MAAEWEPSNRYGRNAALQGSGEATPHKSQRICGHQPGEPNQLDWGERCWAQLHRTCT